MKLIYACLWWALSKLLWFDKKVSDLQIETEDVAIGVLETVSGSLCTIRVDYLNKNQPAWLLYILSMEL